MLFLLNMRFFVLIKILVHIDIGNSFEKLFFVLQVLNFQLVVSYEPLFQMKSSLVSHRQQCICLVLPVYEGLLVETLPVVRG